MRSVLHRTEAKCYRYGALYFFVLCLLCLFSLVVYGKSENVKSIKLSLDEAILLAIRGNPNVQKSQLDFVVTKFALSVAKWNFQPQFQFQAQRNVVRTVTAGQEDTNTTTTIQPSVSLNTPVGTNLKLTSINNITGHYNPSLGLQVIQPLMRGFGRAVVEADLYNAMDDLRTKRLEIEGVLRDTVTSVILAYLEVVSAQQTISIDQDALKRAQKSVQQTKLFIKAGSKARSELVTVQANVATAQATLEDDRNNLKQKEYALLTAIGLDPNTSVRYSSIDIEKLINKYHVPKLQETKQRVLSNDISYQVSQITLNGATKRSLLVAKDNTRWQLDLTVNGVMGNGSGGGRNAGINSLTNGANQQQSALLNLTVPIDDRKAQQAVLQAKIALREAEIGLKKQRWDIDTKAINEWNNTFSTKRSLVFARDAEKLQQKTYKISFKKYSYGLIDSLELQSAQKELISSEQSYVKARISYLTSLVNLDEMIGSTLKTWHINVRLGECENESKLWGE